MSNKQFVKEFLITAAIASIATIAVTYLYNLIIHGVGLVDWRTTFRFAILFGLVLTWIRNLRSKKS
jgi:hypothetical protein